MIVKKNGFTLIELLLSVVLLGLIFQYLFSVINSVKKRNEPYKKISKDIQEDKEIYKLLSADLINNMGGISVSAYKRFDMVVFESYHSLYSLKHPFIYYFVSKENNSLIRIEATKNFNILKERNPFKIRYYGDIVVTNVQSFKASKRNGIFTLLLRSSGHQNMILSIPTVGKEK